MATTVILRRSCHFCRLRKIRCSGSTICSACRERNIDCVYEVETAKGRPRATARRGTKSGKPDGYAGSDSSSSQTDLSSVGNDMPSKSSLNFSHVPDMATDMEKMFNEVYGDETPSTITGASGLNPYQLGLRNFNNQVMNSTNEYLSLDLSEDFPKDGFPETMNYHRLLGSISYEMVEMLANRFGHLGCELLGDVRARFFTRSLAKDRTPTMFDPTPASTPPPSDSAANSSSSSSSSSSSTSNSPSWSPRSQRLLSAEGCDLLGDLDYHKAVQMTDVWFSAHPLSCIVSKTLFLRSLRSNEKKDEILLAIILADATDIHSDKSVPSSRVLFNWAASRLRNRPSSNASLSTAQALTLLGWYELCRSRVRRAICYLGYAGRLIQKIKKQMAANEKEGVGHGVQVNGVSELDVEKELVLNIYWLTFSLTLWAFMQMDQPFLNLLPAMVPVAFPPVDETESVVIALDIASDNVSTLQSQRRSIRELWPISNITSTVSHIYALYPRDMAGAESTLKSSISDWQSQSLHQLRRLISQPQDLHALCVKIRLILVSASDSLNSAVHNVRSKAVVLAVLHSIVVHMLFPRTPPTSDEDEGEPPVVTADVMNNFLSSAALLIEHSRIIIAPDRGSAEEFITSTHARICSAVETVVLALDACARAMSYFLLRMQEGSLNEENVVSRRRGELINLSSQLYELAKTEALIYPGSRLRVVKKSLKRVIEGLRGSPGRSMSAPSVCSTTTADLSLPARTSHSGRSSRQPSTTRSRSTVSVNSKSPSIHEHDSNATPSWHEPVYSHSKEAYSNQPLTPHNHHPHHQHTNSLDSHHHFDMSNSGAYLPESGADFFNVQDVMNLDFDDTSLFDNMNWYMSPTGESGPEHTTEAPSKTAPEDFMMGMMHSSHADINPFQDFETTSTGVPDHGQRARA